MIKPIGEPLQNLTREEPQELRNETLKQNAELAKDLLKGDLDATMQEQ